MALSPLTNVRLKASCVRTVLEWTIGKPARKAELVNAEAWLQEVLAKA
jgi:hypothetical protein